jgi:uncharacterized protein (TIGR03086 family)
MDLVTLYSRTVESWLNRVDGVQDDQWDLQTPCSAWTVRDLVNHVVGEDLWTAPLLEGTTIEEVGDRFDGDLLADDPRAAAKAAGNEATASAAERVPAGGSVHLSYGDEDMGEYVRQLCADHLIHGWDLAAAVGGDTDLDAELVAEVAAWFAEREAGYRGAGIIGPPQPRTGDAAGDLLAAFGRRQGWGLTDAALATFSAAFGRGDVDAIMALMTDDCVFEATGPAPDGTRFEGAANVRAVWDDLFGNTADAAFTEEESFVTGDRGVLRWLFTWTNPDGSPGHVRGVDVLRLRDGKVCEKYSYVKG